MSKPNKIEIKNNFCFIQYEEYPTKKELFDYKIYLSKINAELQDQFSVMLSENGETENKESFVHHYQVSSVSFDGEIEPETWVKLQKFFKEHLNNLAFDFINAEVKTFTYTVMIEVQKVI